jgi:uncharacterized protein (DUF952 family)
VPIRARLTHSGSGRLARVDNRSHDTGVIFHIARERDWDAARESGSYGVSTRGARLEDIGFIHASFEHQVARVGSVVYRDAAEPLVVLVIATDRLAVPVVVENLEGGDEGFPHIYGPLPVSAVVAVKQASVSPDGRFVIEDAANG